MFAGYGTPDIKGGLGRYTLYTTRTFSDKKKGDIIQVYPNNGTIETKVTGPAVAKLTHQEPSEVSMKIKVDKQKKKITLNVCDKDYEVEVGAWSDWIRLKFSLGFFRSAYGIVRFYLKRIEPDFFLYMTPIQIDPKEPIFPISYPDESVGFTSVYLNLKGREEKGIVEPGDEEKKVKEEIIEVLKKFLDPKNGQSPIRDVYDGKTLYSGPNKSSAPDLVLGFNHKYRASWQTAIGGAPASIIDDNAKRWSGDHLMDASTVPGILFMNQKRSRKNPTVLDIAPTVLKCLDIPSEKVMQGVSLLFF